MRTFPIYLLVLLVLVVFPLVLTGCPQDSPEVPGGEAAMVDEPPPPDDDADQPSAADIPESAETLADAMVAFQRPTSLEITILTAGEDNPEPMAIKLEDGKPVAYRAESPDGVMIMDMVESVMYIYDPEDNSALKMPMDEAQASDLPQPYDFQEPDSKVVGSETVDGVDCWVVEVAGEHGVGKVWVGKADGLLRQIAEGDEMVKIQYSRINEIPDSEFEVPEGAKIEDFTDMPVMPEGGG